MEISCFVKLTCTKPLISNCSISELNAVEIVHAYYLNLFAVYLHSK